MPHVFLLGRETTFSSDELGLVAVLGVGYRIIWVAISAVFGTSALDAYEQCSVALSNDTSEPPLFKPTLFLGLLAGQSTMQLLLFVAMLYATTRGAIIQPHKRWAVAYIVMLMFFFEFILVATSGFGVYILATMQGHDGVQVCDKFQLATGANQTEILGDLVEDLDMVASYTLLGVIFSIINNFGFVLIVWLSLNRNRAIRSKDAVSRYERNVDAWDSRLRCGFRCATMFTCGVVGGITGDSREEGYRAMAEIFTDYFKDSGLSSLDCFAALLLIRAEQKSSQKIAIADKEVRDNEVWTDVATSPSSPKLTLKSQQSFKGPLGSVKTIKGIQRPIDMEDGSGSDHEAHHDTGDEFAEFLNDAMAYAPYMLAVYGWKLFLIMHRGSPLRGIRKLMLNRNKMGTGKVTGDNCFGCYQGAMASTMGDSIDVMHASFVCVAGEQVPYVVAVDHSKKKVLLMIRGTHSLGDLFTDVILKPKEMKEAGENWGFDGKGHYAHGGFLGVAMTIREDLERTGVLHKLLGVAKQGGERHMTPVEGMTTEGIVEVDTSALPSVNSYQLVLVGHSMGAAIAAMVGLMLRPMFPNLFCMGYSTPGTCLSFEIAEECSSWMRTVWVGKDFVARGSYRALEELRERVYDVLVRCKVNKNTVLRSLFTDTPADRMLYTAEDAPDTPESRKLDQARARLKQRAMASVFSKHPLFTPGKMLHLVKVETESTPHCTGLSFCKKVKRRFVPTWVHDRTVVKDIQISSRMLLDHFPDYVAETIENVADEYCYFSPTSDKLLMKMTSPSTTMKKNLVHTVNPQFDDDLSEEEEMNVIANSL